MDILVADDDEDLLEILVEALRDEGFDVSGVPDGDRLLEVLATASPRLMLLDLSMPALDLDATLRLVRSTDRAGQTWVVALSGGDRLDDVSARYGFDGALRKPVDLARLTRLAIRSCRDASGRDSATELA